MASTPPISLTIAGFDTCAGAGLQADLLTFHNHGFHCLTAMSSLVVETPLLVKETQAIEASLLCEQVRLLLATYSVSTIKIGLLASPAQVTALSEILREFQSQHSTPIVLDPVGISSSGTAMQEEGTRDALNSSLAPLATLITPNLPEAQSLLGNEGHGKECSPEETAQALAEKVGTAVLLTGGHHGDQEEICDLLIQNGQKTTFCDSRIETISPLHGTGCVLSSSIAAELGRGKNLANAIEGARRYLRNALHDFHSFPHSEPLLALNHHSAGRHDQ